MGSGAHWWPASLQMAAACKNVLYETAPLLAFSSSDKRARAGAPAATCCFSAAMVFSAVASRASAALNSSSASRRARISLRQRCANSESLPPSAESHRMLMCERAATRAPGVSASSSWLLAAGAGAGARGAGAGGGGGRGGGDGSSSIRSSASVRCALPGGGRPKLAPCLDTVAQPPTAGRLLSGRTVSTAERVLLAGGAACSSAASAEAFLRTAAAQSLWMRVDAEDAGPSASPRSRATAGSPLAASPPLRDQFMVPHHQQPSI